MAIALDTPFAAAPARPALRTGTFAVAALGSLGAGAVHAAAIGTHGEHRQAVVTFSLVAIAQLGLGGLALVSRRTPVGLALAVANVAFVAGWVLAKRSGIGFVDGLEEKEAIQWADALAAGLAAFAVLLVLATALRSWRLPGSDALVRVLALPVAALTVTGMVAAGSHAHATGEAAHDHDSAAAATEAGAIEEVSSAVPPKPFIPGQPIDLGGVEGVTAEQQARAEYLLAATLYTLPRWSDFQVAEAEGWFSIGDGVTGYEHFVNPSTFDDGKILDPTAPESLVYQLENGERKLVAAMYMLPPGSTLADVPELGGALTQWHIHDNLCFTTSGRVAGLRAPGGPCEPPLVIGGENPMIHVWIVSHRCGPFSALDGIAGGSPPPGEAQLCDHAHGH